MTDDDDTPLTPEEIAERDKVPTWGTEIFATPIDANGVLGDVLLEPKPKSAIPRHEET